MESRIHGSTMPVLEVQLSPGEKIISESGELSWMTQSINLKTNTGGGGIKGVFKRVASGGSLFMTQYSAEGAPGHVAFATKLPGVIMPISVSDSPEGTWVGHKHAFLCATEGVQLGWAMQKKLGAGMFGGNGFLMQSITGNGEAWVELSGEVVPYDLAPGETLRVHPGHIGLFHSSVSFNITTVPGIKNKFFAGDGLILATLTGPGRVYLQSLTISRLAHAIAESTSVTDGISGGAKGALGGFAAGSILGDILGS